MAGLVAPEIRKRVEETKRAEVEPPIEDIAKRYLDGESAQVLGKECGVTARTIQRRLKRWMLAGHGDGAYAALVTEALVNRIADADDMLEAARDPVQVAKYREMARFARLDFERRRPALYGPKQEVKHTGPAPSFQVVLLAAPSDGGRVIEMERVASLAAPAAGVEKGEEDGLLREQQREAAGVSCVGAGICEGDGDAEGGAG